MNIFASINKWQVLALVCLMLVVSSFEMFGLSLFIPIIDLFQREGAKTTSFTTYLSGIVTSLGLRPSLNVFLVLLSLLFLVKGTLAMWMRFVSVNIASGLQHRIRVALFNALLGSDVAYINGQRQGALLSALNEHTQRASQTFFILVQAATQWVTILVYAVFVLLISWQLSLVALGCGLFIFPMIRRIGWQAHDHGRRLTSALESVQHTALEVLQAKKLVNAMNWQKPLSEGYRALSISVRDEWKWMAFWSNSPSIILQSVSVVILSVLIWGSMRFGLSGSMLGAFVLAFIRLLPAAQSASALGADFRANLPAIHRVEEILTQAATRQEPSGGLPFASLQRSIRLESVGFRYDSSDRVLDNLDIEIPRGKIVAFVGPSGAGKTTIADIIMGLHRPESGKVLVDGTDLNTLDIKSYRARIAYVPQEPVLFHGSIRDNLTLGLVQPVSDEEIRRVCELVGAWEFVSQRSEGLATLIGDRGVLFSGGQRQRLVLVRALLRKPDLLILDEATSALDQESEQWVKQAMQRLRAEGRCTIVVIAHRFATIEKADGIYRIADGRALDLGRWEEAKAQLLSARQELELM